MIAVVSSGMFYKKLLLNNSSNTLSNDKSNMTISININGVNSYYSQDLLYFIKDGYTVTKREKIFTYNTSNITAGNIGACEYDSINNNIIRGSYSQTTILSISIIAIELYFVICGLIIYYDGNLGNTTNLLSIISYNSRGEYISNMSVIGNYSTPYFYPKIFNGNNNNIWLFYYTGGSATPFVNFNLITISSNGILTLSKTVTTLYNNSLSISPNTLRLPYFTRLYNS
jgi:hypothetical protein